jgi:hypothetical protein
MVKDELMLRAGSGVAFEESFAVEVPKLWFERSPISSTRSLLDEYESVTVR